MSEGMTTAEAAARIGVTTNVLRDWIAQGLITPHGEGEGRQRRYAWSASDVEDAMALKQKQPTKSLAETTLDSLGGEDFTRNLSQGRKLCTKLTGEEVVVVGPRGVRIMNRKTYISGVISVVGDPALVLT
jgi:hypothetical protein